MFPLVLKVLKKFQLHIHAHNAVNTTKQHRRVTRGGRGGGLPCPFSKNGKKCPNLEKKCPNCGQLWLKFLVWNAAFKSFQAKNRTFFPGGAFLSRAVVECLLKCPNSEKTPLPEKIPGYASATFEPSKAKSLF